MELDEYFNILPYRIIITNYARAQYRKLKNADPQKIYAIYGHVYNSKWYIGQTVDYENLNKRFGTNGNRYLIKNSYGDYEHPKFARALNKYDWDNFQHYILGFYTAENIDKAEISWIRRKDSFNNGYNSDICGRCAKLKAPQNEKISKALEGHFVSEETRKKISSSLKSSNARSDISKYWFKSGRENPMYGKDVNYIENLGGAKAGAENYFYGKTHSKDVKNILSKKAQSRKLSEHTRERIKRSSKKRSQELSTEKQEHPERFIGRCKPVAMLDKDGNTIRKFISATEAEKLSGISRILISRCASGKSYTAGGYKWKYILAKEVENDIRCEN